MYGNNLNHTQLKTYLTLLTSRNLLAHNSDRYVTTEKGHRFLEAFVWLNDVLENRAHKTLLKIINESYKEAEITYMGASSHIGNPTRPNPLKKAAIVVLISLTREAEKKTSEELKTEIHKALKEGFAKIPWVAVESVTILEE